MIIVAVSFVKRKLYGYNTLYKAVKAYYRCICGLKSGNMVGSDSYIYLLHSGD